MPPVGLVPFEDPETGEVLVVDTAGRAFRERFAALTQERDEEVRRLFRQLRIDFAEIDTDKPYLDPIVRLFHRRALRY